MSEFTLMEQSMMTKDLTDQQKMLFSSQFESSKKDPGTILVLSILFGVSGVDRFMLGDMGMGILKMLTLGGCGILAIVDWFTAKDRTAEFNRKKAIEILNTIKMTCAAPTPQFVSSAPTPTPTPTPFPQMPTERKFCMECGTQIAAETKFCSKCGASQAIS